MGLSQKLSPGFAIEIFLPINERHSCMASRVQDIKVAAIILTCFNDMSGF